MLHAAQRPAVGALHEAPVSTFFFAAAFFLSPARTGLETSAAVSTATHRVLIMVPSTESQGIGAIATSPKGKEVTEGNHGFPSVS
jgi:hypothetical protein